MAQADTALSEEPSKVTQLVEWFNQIPGMSWAIAGFVLFALVVAAILALTGNLDKIFSFKAFRKANAEEASEQQQLIAIRRNLLQQMQTNVALRLENSLHNLVRVDLEQEEQRHRVGARKKAPLAKVEKQTPPFKDLIPRGLAVFRNGRGIEPVAPVETTYSIFHRPDIGGRLLIVGEPGAGKTTELLTVAQRLIEEAKNDDDKPIPLIFELSSWTSGTPILRWLEQQLQQTYGVSRRLTEPLEQQWIQPNRLLFLLDGLDELDQRNQSACVEALEAFLARHPALSAIVCCRCEEYEQGRLLLKQLKGAIYLQAVGSEQIQQYLKELDRERLWDDIQAQPERLHLARSPLFLALLVVAYQEHSIQDTETLFNAYIQKQLHEPNHQGAYKPGKGITPDKTLRYLGWLASQLKQRNKTEFLIEDLQPDWLASKPQELICRLIYLLTIGLMSGLIVVLIHWPIYGLSSGLGLGLIVGLFFGMGVIVPEEKPNWDVRKGLSVGLSVGLLFGLSAWLGVGLDVGLIVGLSTWLSVDLTVSLGTAILHFILRIILTTNGYTPWNYALFLEHAAQHRFIQRTGGRDRFIHDLLREHFAQMTPQQQAELAQPPRENRSQRL